MINSAKSGNGGVKQIGIKAQQVIVSRDEFRRWAGQTVLDCRFRACQNSPRGINKQRAECSRHMKLEKFPAKLPASRDFGSPRSASRARCDSSAGASAASAVRGAPT